jgi:hypothetical protein
MKPLSGLLLKVAVFASHPTGAVVLISAAQNLFIQATKLLRLRPQTAGALNVEGAPLVECANATLDGPDLTA